MLDYMLLQFVTIYFCTHTVGFDVMDLGGGFSSLAASSGIATTGSGACCGLFLGGPYSLLICLLSVSDSSVLRPIPGGLDPSFALIHSDGKLLRNQRDDICTYTNSIHTTCVTQYIIINTHTCTYNALCSLYHIWYHAVFVFCNA